MAAWPVVAMIGASLVLAGGVIGIFGGVAAFAGNERLSNVLLLFVGVPLALLGGAIVILGAVGFWTIPIVAVLGAFGWLVRPRKQVKP